MNAPKEIVLIGYSGHAFVVADIFETMKRKVIGYCDSVEKNENPYNLKYFGTENSEIGLKALHHFDYFIAIGSNQIRRKIFEHLKSKVIALPINAVHKNSIVAKNAKLQSGVMIAAGATINPLAQIGNGVICNTGCIIEHENIIGDFAHIAPGTTLCGNVSIGENSFVGANSVVRQGISIGSNVVIGAGSVVVKNIPDNCLALGNPCRVIKFTVNK